MENKIKIRKIKFLKFLRDFLIMVIIPLVLVVLIGWGLWLIRSKNNGFDTAAALISTIVFVIIFAIVSFATYNKLKTKLQSPLVDVLAILIMLAISTFIRTWVCTTSIPDAWFNSTDLGIWLKHFYMSIGTFGFTDLEFPEVLSSIPYYRDLLYSLYYLLPINLAFVLLIVGSYNLAFGFYSFIGLQIQIRFKKLHFIMTFINWIRKVKYNYYIFTSLDENSISFAKKIKNKQDIVIFYGDDIPAFDSKNKLCKDVASSGFYYYPTVDSDKSVIRKIFGYKSTWEIKNKSIYIFAFNLNDRLIPDEVKNSSEVFDQISKLEYGKKQDLNLIFLNLIFKDILEKIDKYIKNKQASNEEQTSNEEQPSNEKQTSNEEQKDVIFFKEIKSIIESYINKNKNINDTCKDLNKLFNGPNDKDIKENKLFKIINKKLFKINKKLFYFEIKSYKRGNIKFFILSKDNLNSSIYQNKYNALTGKVDPIYIKPELYVLSECAVAAKELALDISLIQKSELDKINKKNNDPNSEKKEQTDKQLLFGDMELYIVGFGGLGQEVLNKLYANNIVSSLRIEKGKLVIDYNTFKAFVFEQEKYSGDLDKRIKDYQSLYRYYNVYKTNDTLLNYNKNLISDYFYFILRAFNKKINDIGNSIISFKSKFKSTLINYNNEISIIVDRIKRIDKEEYVKFKYDFTLVLAITKNLKRIYSSFENISKSNVEASNICEAIKKIFEEDKFVDLCLRAYQEELNMHIKNNDYVNEIKGFSNKYNYMFDDIKTILRYDNENSFIDDMSKLNDKLNTCSTHLENVDSIIIKIYRNEYDKNSIKYNDVYNPPHIYFSDNKDIFKQFDDITGQDKVYADLEKTRRVFVFTTGSDETNINYANYLIKDIRKEYHSKAFIPKKDGVRTLCDDADIIAINVRDAKNIYKIDLNGGDFISDDTSNVDRTDKKIFFSPIYNLYVIVFGLFDKIYDESLINYDNDMLYNFSYTKNYNYIDRIIKEKIPFDGQNSKKETFNELVKDFKFSEDTGNLFTEIRQNVSLINSVFIELDNENYFEALQSYKKLCEYNKILSMPQIDDLLEIDGFNVLKNNKKLKEIDDDRKKQSIKISNIKKIKTYSYLQNYESWNSIPLSHKESNSMVELYRKALYLFYEFVDKNEINTNEAVFELMKLEHYRWIRQQISDGWNLNFDKEKNYKYHTDLRNLFEIGIEKRMYDLINIMCSVNLSTALNNNSKQEPGNNN